MRVARVIPCLDVTAGRVVKGTNFVDLRDAGDPVELAARYDAEGADELVFLDITASSDDRQTTVDMVYRVAGQVYIPFTVGGGIRSLEDARRMLRAGADKVSVNTAAVQRDAPGDAAEGADARTQDYLATGGALTCIGPRKSGNTSRTWVIVSSSLAHLHTYPACPTGGGVVHRTRTWADGTGPPLTDR